MAAPAFQAIGTYVTTTTGTLSVPWPAHAVNDIALLCVETSASTGTNLSVASGFVQIGAIAGSQTDCSVYWCRATSTAMANPTLGGVFNHQAAVIATVRGCITTGNPYSSFATGTTAAAATFDFPTVTSLVADTLAFFVAASDTDAATAWMTSVTNAALSGITEHFDSGTTTGDGGQLGIYSGTKAVAGAYGTSAAVLASSRESAYMTIALVPPSVPSIVRQMLQYHG